MTVFCYYKNFTKLLRWSMVFGATWFPVPRAWSFIFRSRINHLLFPLGWEPCFYVGSANNPEGPASASLPSSWSQLHQPDAFSETLHVWIAVSLFNFVLTIRSQTKPPLTPCEIASEKSPDSIFAEGMEEGDRGCPMKKVWRKEMGCRMKKGWRKMVEAVLHKRDGRRRQELSWVEGIEERDRGCLDAKTSWLHNWGLRHVSVLMIHLTSEAGSSLCLGKWAPCQLWYACAVPHLQLHRS